MSECPTSGAALAFFITVPPLAKNTAAERLPMTVSPPTTDNAAIEPPPNPVLEGVDVLVDELLLVVVVVGESVDELVLVVGDEPVSEIREATQLEP